jgi:hypothetical protein
MSVSAPNIIALTEQTSVDSESGWQRWRRFLAATLVMGFVWLVVLPYIGEQPVVSDHIKHQQELGIDPSAMFYSELEIAPSIAHRIERLQETHTMSWHKAAVRGTDGRPGE